MDSNKNFLDSRATNLQVFSEPLHGALSTRQLSIVNKIPPGHKT